MSREDEHDAQTTSEMRSTSEKQVAANRRNAQHSTGPRSHAGKRRSSRNAEKHGLYAREIRAVTGGLLREDPRQLDDLLDAVVAALAPRDVLETMRAIEIGRLHLVERRLDVLECKLLDQLSRGSYPSPDDAAECYLLGHISEWSHARVDGLDWPGKDDEPAPWVSMLAYLLKKMDKKTRVSGRWDDDVKPGTPAEWRVVFEIIVNHLLPSPADLAAWVSEREYEQMQLEAARDARTADELVLELEASIARRSRVAAQLSRQFAIYAELQDRDLE